MTDPEPVTLAGGDVNTVRKWLSDDLRCSRVLRNGVPVGGRDVPRPAVVHNVFGSAQPAAVRAFLAHLLVGNRVEAGVTAVDAALWIDAAGLRGERVDVQVLAREQHLSARQVHRRILRVDAALARLLNEAGAVIALEDHHSSSRLDGQELLETLRAECLASRNSLRATDALVAFLRNRAGEPLTALPQRSGAATYTDGNKDTRYRDAGRIVNWLATLAHRPPLAPLRAPTDLGRNLVTVDAVELSGDPHHSLDQLELAINSNQREALPLLLHHVGRLIPDVASAGVSARLRYLGLAYFATFEPQNVHALRFARARQDEALRHSALGVHDWGVFKGMTGRAFMLGALGHHGAAVRGYLTAVDHVEKHRPSGVDHIPDLSDAYGRIAHHEALRGGNRERAYRAIRRMERIAEGRDDLEIHYTLARTKLEVELGFGVRRSDLEVDFSRPGVCRRIDGAFDSFTELSARIGKANRELTGCDLTALYAIALRDRGMLDDAVRRFGEIVARHGGYANQARRLNARLQAASSLSRVFVDVPEVAGRYDPLSADADAIPARPTGLLITPCAA